MNLNHIILDVDGTLTDGIIQYGDDGLEHKAFHTKDGLILKAMSRLDITVIFITGRRSEAVTRRAADLNTIAFQGVQDKLPVLQKWLTERAIEATQCAYIGDDLNDFEAMSYCGFKACPADAVTEIKSICNYVSPFCGGRGAVRDICEQLLKQDGRYHELLQFYGIGDYS